MQSTTPTNPSSTTKSKAVALTAPQLRAKRSSWAAARYFLKRNKLVTIGIVIIVFWIFIAITAGVIAPFGPLEQNLIDRLQAPNSTYLFGTDQLGRDVLSRVMYGGRISIPAAVMVVIAAGIVGTLVGSIAGFLGGATEEVFMRVTDVFMAFPTLILAMAIAAALGPSISNAIVTLAIVWWPGYARVVRGLVLSIKENEYVTASRAIGSTEPRVLRRVVLPNAMAPVLVLATLDLGNAILVFAGLSFLGLGPEPSTPEWGRMVADGLAYFDQWWISTFPGLAIFTIVMAFNFVGDGLRDALDPRLRRQI